LRSSTQAFSFDKVPNIVPVLPCRSWGVERKEVVEMPSYNEICQESLVPKLSELRGTERRLSVI
jgi:hypothetical protein